MQQNITIACAAFEKNPDGSWSSTRVTDIQIPGKSIRLGPGHVFKKGMNVWGIDVAQLLDENCPE
jgi:hypothetical protein